MMWSRGTSYLTQLAGPQRLQTPLHLTAFGWCLGLFGLNLSLRRLQISLAMAQNAATPVNTQKTFQMDYRGVVPFSRKQVPEAGFEPQPFRNAKKTKNSEDHGHHRILFHWGLVKTVVGKFAASMMEQAITTAQISVKDQLPKCFLNQSSRNQLLLLESPGMSNGQVFSCCFFLAGKRKHQKGKTTAKSVSSLWVEICGNNQRMQKHARICFINDLPPRWTWAWLENATKKRRSISGPGVFWQLLATSTENSRDPATNLLSLDFSVATYLNQFACISYTKNEKEQ